MRNLLIPLFAASTIVFSIAPTSADLDDPLFKLRASDGAGGDRFGNSVAISGEIAIVGAHRNDDNGTNSGCAYLFDTASGQQLLKLLPNDGAAVDVFGVSVAISGTVAMVGAPQNDDNGSNSGAAYLFDTASGGLLFKLLPKDGAASDIFGSSVAISGPIAIVGAPGDDDNGGLSGSVYLFDTTNGLQIAKLLPIGGIGGDLFGTSVAINGDIAIVGATGVGPNTGAAYLFSTITGVQIAQLQANDGASGDLFGFTVGISDTAAIVGAPNHDDNGSNSGSAYLFNIDTGAQFDKLLPIDGQGGFAFGISVAISDTTAIIGANQDFDMGIGSGAAYLFNIASGLQLDKLRPIDGANFDRFGNSVAISGAIVIIGAVFDDDDGSESGSAYLTADDTDRDGLLDSWENNGIPYFDKGEVLQHFMLPGADPNHKDLYVEIDSMIGLGFAPAAQIPVIQAFANAPNSLVDNPDNLDGINLHLLIDETNIPVAPFPNVFTDFDVVKAAHFGTPAEQGNAALLHEKAKAYRYCIFGSTYGGGSSSGLAERGGNDFMVTLGGWTTPGGTTKQQSGTFMHEFGHTLGLLHSGPLSQSSPAEKAGPDRHYNLKPNYYSIMNYNWQTPKPWHTPGSWPLSGNNSGYSRAALNTLNESDLDEIAGLIPPEHAAIYPAPGFVVPFNVETDPDLPPILRGAMIGFGIPVDWNDNGNPDPHDPGNLIARDVNRVRPGWPASPGTTLPGHDDWSYLEYDFKYSPYLNDGEHPLEDPQEMTLEDQQELDNILPPACVGDITLDGTVSVPDLLELFSAWGPCQIGIACLHDLDESGVVSVSDLLILFAKWGTCP